jgi:hypothetical protein
LSTSAPAAAPPAGQGETTPPAQPPASGQGGGQGQSTADGGFNWGLFPDVPEGQRELLRPHLTNVLGHVTRMEQQYAPYKGLTEAIQPDQVQGLLGFLNNYSNDPLSTWLGLAQSLQESGVINNPAFNMDALQAMIQGQQQQAPVAGMGGGEEIPPWAQEMQAQLQQYQQQEQARQEQAQQQQEAQLLQDAHSQMREALTAGGVPEEVQTDQRLTAALIVHEGDVQAAIQSFTTDREGYLKGFVGQNGQQPPPRVGNIDVPNNLKGKKGDSFRQASLGAEQMLKQANAAGAQ